MDSIGVELAIYDKLNTSLLIDVIPQRYSPTYLEELRGPGGGAFTISKSDPQLLANPGLLDYRNIVRVMVEGVLRGAWVITKKSEVLIGQGELADQAYQVSGPGLRVWATDSVVYPLEPLGRLTKTDRTFSFASPRGIWYDPTAWVPIYQMCRMDAQRLLLATFLANAVVPAADDSTAPATAPDGKAKRVGGFIITGSTTTSSISTDSVVIGGYQLYGTVAAPSNYWWDAAGFHPVQVLANAPATDPVTGATRYPTLVGPGYVAYALVDPITGVWDSSTSDALLDQARHRYYDGATFQTTTNASTSLNEIPPPSWTDVNPWKYGPMDWPTGWAPHARWIWSQESRGTSPAPAGSVYFRREFTIPAAARYSLAISADNSFTAYMDGEVVVDSQDVNSSSRFAQVDLDLAVGAHVLAVKVTSWAAGTAGLLAALMAYGDPTSPTPSGALLVTDNTTSLGGQWLCDPYPATPPGWTPGEVLLALLAEAQARGVATALNLIPTFTATLDTYGNAWDRNVDWSFGLGTEYGDVITKMEEIKADFFFEPQADGTVKLHAYTSRGLDRSVQTATTQPVVLRPGHNVTSATEDNEFTLVKNSLLTSSNDGWFAPTDTISTLNYGRVEGFLNVPGTQAMATQVATATLTKLGLSQDATTVGFEPFPDHTPWVDFGVGDLVQAPASAAYGAGGAVTPRRIMSLSLSEDADTSRVLYTAEFGTINRDRQERIERWLTSIGGGTLGGTVANATTNATTTGSAPVSYPSTGIPTRDSVVVNPVLIGQVISGANIQPGSIMASDKMVANSITANSAIIANAAINSAQIVSLSANQISAGTIMAEIALAGRIATALTGARAEMNSVGFHAFNALNQEVFTADNLGNVFMQGRLATGNAPDARIEMADDDLLLGSFDNGIAPRLAFYTGAADELVPGYVVARDDRLLNLDINQLTLQIESPVAYARSAVAGDAPFSHQLGFTYISLIGETDQSTTSAGIIMGGRPHNATGNGKWSYTQFVVDQYMYSTFQSTLDATSNSPPIVVGDTSVLCLSISNTQLFVRDTTGIPGFLQLQPGVGPGGTTGGVRIIPDGIGSGSSATPTSVRHPFQIGANVSYNLRVDNSSINAVNNGAWSTSGLFLNSDGSGGVGGPVTIGASTGNINMLGAVVVVGLTSGANVNINSNQVWAMTNGVGSNLFLNYSSNGGVWIGNNTAAGSDLLCAAMRPVKFSAAGPGGTIVSTAAGGVSSNALGTTFTNVPASGCIRIDYSARLTIVTGATAQRGFVGVQIQVGNSAGAIIYATTDIESCEVGVGASITGNEGVSTVGKSIVVPSGILTAGATYFIVITNRVTAGTTSVTSSNASITVTPMP